MSRGSSELKIAFETSSLRIPIEQIQPLREVSERVKKSVKYHQIAASIKEVGIIEPPVVVRDSGTPRRSTCSMGTCASRSHGSRALARSCV